MPVRRAGNRELLAGEYDNIRRSSFSRWTAALRGARAASRAPARILWIGDSIAEGFNVDGIVTERETRPSIRLIDHLNGTLVPYEKVFDGLMGFNNGVGPQAYDIRWTPGATFGALAFGASWGLTGIYDGNVGASGSTSTSSYGPFTCNAFKTYHVLTNNVSNPTYAIGLDGGATTDVNATAGVFIGGIGTATATAGSYTSHTLNVVSKVSTSAYLLAVEVVRDVANGLISVGSAGVGATNSATWADNSNPGVTPRDCVQAAAPDLTIISLGGNDQGAGVSASSFDTNMRSLVAACQVTGDVITMAPYGNLFANPDLRYQYRDVFRNIARDTASAHFELGLRWGDVFAQADQGGYLSTDETHPTRYGYSDMAKAVAEILLTIDAN